LKTSHDSLEKAALQQYVSASWLNGEKLTQAIGLAQAVARLQRQDNDMSVKSFNWKQAGYAAAETATGQADGGLFSRS